MTLLHIAQRICTTMGTPLRRDNGAYAADPASFAELRDTKMPSVIVELCFISNSSDCQKFNNTTGDSIGDAISRGINASGYYFLLAGANKL